MVNLKISLMGNKFMISTQIEDKASCGIRLKQLRLMAGFTRREFQNRFGINQNTMHAWENGRLALTRKGATKVISAMILVGVECSLSWLMNGIGKKPCFIETHQDQKNSTVHEEKGSIYIEDNFELLKEIEFFKNTNPENTVFLINDDGMLPFYEIGDFVGGKRKFDNFEKYSGYNCIIELSKNDILVRKIKFNYKSSVLSAFCSNINTDESEPIINNIRPISITPIVWHRRVLRLE